MDRSLVFNNAGALVLHNGHSRVALELFRAALESKLAYERAHPPDAPMASDPVDRCVTPECVVRAEGHLTNMECYSSEVDPTQPNPALEDGIIEPAVPLASLGFLPFLYLQPFRLPSSGTSSQLTSSIIVFNLGLVHHHASRTSAKAAAFYEIAAALLGGEPPSRDSAVLRLALMNNFGVWCYENGDGESLGTCVEHLSSLLQHARPMLDAGIHESITNNIKWLLTPPNGGSPAA